MTRKSTKKIVVMVLVLLMVCSNLTFAKGDDSKGHWAEKSIQSWVDKGYIKGYPDGSFKPENNITRAEFISLVNRAFEFTDENPVSYQDMKESHWAYNESKKASAAGYIVGYEDGSFRPNNNITRQEVATIITRLLKLEEAKTSQVFLALSDVEEIPEWSSGAISAVVNKGYMRLRDGQSFAPTSPATRAEVIAALDSSYLAFVKVEYKVGGTYTAGTVDGSLEINTKDLILENTTIYGNLIIGEDVGDGNVTLKDVRIKGDTMVQGGGMHTIIIEDSQISNLIIEKKDGKVRILAKGTTYINDTQMKSAGKLESDHKDASHYGYVLIGENIASDEPIILKGNFESVEVKSGTNQMKVEGGRIRDFIIAKTAKDVKVDLAE